MAQYSGLDHGVTKSWTQLNDFHFHFSLSSEIKIHNLEGSI